MNPILFMLALIVGCSFLWLAGVWALYEGNIRDSAPLSVPCALIGLSVLIAAGLGMAGILT